MANSAKDDLLARLAGRGNDEGESGAWATVAATPPTHEEAAGAPVVADEDSGESRLDSLLDNIHRLTDQDPQADGTSQESSDAGAFVPVEPNSFDEAKLTQSEVEALILKLLLARGESTGRNVSDQVRLPFILIDDLLQSMKQDQLVAHKGAAPMNDYVYQLTDVGRELARLHSQQCTYFGAAPVDLEDYIVGVTAQTLVKQRPSVEDLNRAFEDLLINKRMLQRVGPAINSGRGMFLYGSPGNGKTSIAERITKAFGEFIWIPRSIGVNGEIMRLFDPNHHHEKPLEDTKGIIDQRKIDKRWIRISRPTIVVGGELTMDNLEVTTNRMTGVSEAPIQMKSNCGTLVIDDFGRQRMSTDELLNRWIVPLEKSHDYLNLANGKKIQVPFDQLIVFSTNLEPRELVDEAFLRRVPYKIEVVDPSEDEFRTLFKIMAPKLGIEYREEVIQYLISKHYHKENRAFRYCQPRDLLMQVANYCRFVKCEPEMTKEFFDLAVENYFSVM